MIKQIKNNHTLSKNILQKLNRLSNKEDVKKKPEKFEKLYDEFKGIKKSNLRFRKKYKNLIKRWKLNSITKEDIKKFRLCISIRIKSNNILCSLKDKKLSKTLKTISSGVYQIKISKKRLNTNFKSVLKLFLTYVRKKIKSQTKKSLIIKLIAPTRVRKKITKYILKGLGTIRKSPFLFIFKKKKCFNGCRPKKQRKKKRKGVRLFK